MKNLIPMTLTEDDLKILKENLKACAEGLRKGMEDAPETAERNREDKKDDGNKDKNSIPDKE